MSDHKEKAIPGFDPLLLTDNFQRFLRSLDAPVAGYEYVHRILTLENTKESVLVLILVSNIIMYYE
jgi:hypothetical protein